LRRCSRVHDYLRNQTVKYIRIGQRLSFLSLTKRRFYCRSCRRVFSERAEGVAYRQRLTDLAKEQILSHLVDRSFRAAKRQTGIGYHSSRRYLTEKVKPFLWDWKEELSSIGQNPKHSFSLGVDEISFSGHDMIRVITSITNKKVKTILPDDSQVSLVKAIGNIPEAVRDRIAEVAMDLSTNSRSAIEQYLPQAKVAADRFHVIQDANQRLSGERVICQQRIGPAALKSPRPCWKPTGRI
jgi:transposase